MRPPQFIFGTLLLALAACAGNDSSSSGQERVAVVAQQIQILPERLQVDAIGTARAEISAELYPESAGIVEAVHFSAGDHVREGQPLVELDSRRERLAVQLAEVQVEEAAQLLSRYRRIEDTGAISASQIEAGETALASARVELEQARTALADRTIRAPFSGHIGLTDVDRGDRIDTSTPIARLDRRNTLYVDFPAPEEAFSRLRPGQAVSVAPFSDPAREIEARVGAVDSTISADQRSYIVRTVIDNSDDSLRPGMSFRVSFTGSGVDRPAVAEEAVVWGAEGAYLWTVRDGRARRVAATITSRRDGMALVDAAVRPNDLVIVEGVQKVRQGQEVTLVQPAEPEAQDVQLSRGPEPAPDENL